jgi:hypothetical protein
MNFILGNRLLLKLIVKVHFVGLIYSEVNMHGEGHIKCSVFVFVHLPLALYTEATDGH